ncbi:MAG: OmpA family protein [Alphaproteobacteria bacterium]
MKRSLAALISLTLIVLAGCALNPFGGGDPVDRAKNLTPTGSPFNQALYRAYLTRAEEKKQIGKSDAAKYFADRARIAADGRAILPEDLAVDRVGQEAFTELDGARNNLVKYLVDGGRDQAPEEAAQSQSYFDCWVKSAEAKETAEVTRCKTAFGGALSNLQTAINATPSQPTTASASTGSSAAGQERKYAVYFDLNEWHLSAEALTTITDAINTARSEGQSQIISAGHADRSGSAPYNMKLSRRRADFVKDTMVEMGARAEAIKVEAYGETKPAVPTADGVKEPKNRRVEISLLP